MFYQATGRTDEAGHLRAAVKAGRARGSRSRRRTTTSRGAGVRGEGTRAARRIAVSARLPTCGLARIAQAARHPDEALQILEDRLAVDPKNALVLA